MQNEEQNVIYRRTEEKNVISSITALNQEPVVPDDHRGVTEYSRLKLNARETVRICTGDLDGGVSLLSQSKEAEGWKLFPYLSEYTGFLWYGILPYQS